MVMSADDVREMVLVTADTDDTLSVADDASFVSRIFFKRKQN